jgi:hypothetical protein
MASECHIATPPPIEMKLLQNLQSPPPPGKKHSYLLYIKWSKFEQTGLYLGVTTSISISNTNIKYNSEKELTHPHYIKQVIYLQSQNPGDRGRSTVQSSRLAWAIYLALG